MKDTLFRLSWRPRAWTGLGGLLAALLTFALLASSLGARAQGEPAGVESGVAVAYARAGETEPADRAVLPRLALFVAENSSPTPFLPAGPFTAEVTGFVSVDLRDTYEFRAELNGAIEISIRDEVVLDARADGGTTEASKAIRLNRGPNAIRVRYTSPAQGDAFVRLYWRSPVMPWEPVPPAALSRPAEDAAQLEAQELRRGLSLFTEYRCIRCHQGAGDVTPIAEMQKDAPSFEGIGARRTASWLARWITDPQAMRPSAQMPRLLHGPAADADARAIAAFLGSLGKDAGAAPPSEPAASAEQLAAGEQLFASLRCAGCHTLPGDEASADAEPPSADADSATAEASPATAGAADTGFARISLEHVGEKFAPGALAAFLRQPDAHYTWIRMPNFGLSDDEAEAIAAWLRSTTSPPPAPSSAASESEVARGRTLVQSTGCLNCHALSIENRYTAPALGDLPAASWAGEWHASAAAQGPAFALNAGERAAVRAWAATDRRSLERHVPSEFAASHVRQLGCASCHEQIEGVPTLALPLVGGKLRPEWTRRLIGGAVEYKPRPWLEARMPAFPAYADGLSSGLAALHGYGPVSHGAPPMDPADPDAAESGRLMVGEAGCETCHRIGEYGGSQVAGTAGINLAHVTDRLQYAYFERWMRDPQRVVPGTVMPNFFPDGRSPFPDYYNGDLNTQLRALWEYMLGGAQMAAPR